MGAGAGCEGRGVVYHISIHFVVFAFLGLYTRRIQGG